MSRSVPPSPSPPIHVLHVLLSLEPGGMENGVVNLSNGLDPARFRTTVVCLERAGAFASRLRNGINIICLDKPPGLRLDTVLRLGRLLRKIRPAVVHTHNFAALFYGSLSNSLSFRATALVQGEHASLRDEETTPARLRFRRWAFRRCAAVHTVGDALRAELVEAGLPGERIRSICNGVDCQRFRPADAENRAGLLRARGLPPDAVVIGIVGRFGRFKRHDLALRAFGILSSRFPNLHLVMVGDHGPEKERVLDLAAKISGFERVMWLGFQADPAPSYRIMDLLLVPSENEGLSNAMLEAMASGVPCLAHPACGAAEVISPGRDGWLRPVSSADGLADVLHEILQDPENLQRAGREARVTALARFSLEAMIDAYARLYGEAVGSRQ